MTIGLVEIGGALVGAGTLLGAGAAWYQSLLNGRAMRTNSGQRPGEYLELIAGRVNDLHDVVQEHIAQDETRFTRIDDALKR